MLKTNCNFYKIFILIIFTWKLYYIITTKLFKNILRKLCSLIYSTFNLFCTIKLIIYKINIMFETLEIL